MLFNSIEFAVFLPIVFAVYWLIGSKHLKIQNFWLLICSYFFYGWWDWRFLALIAFSSLLDYYVGIGLGRTERHGLRKLLIWASLFVNLGFLGLFKYYNFFAENFAAAFTLLGRPVFDLGTLNIILPVGISFYTFQTLSYSIDVYRRRLEPTTDIVAFGAFVSFFPQLVAGPIERAAQLLPQFYRQRSFDYDKAVDGMRQILWGLFKKIVVADNCAVYVNDIFMHYTEYSGSTLLVGAFLFAFQIYGDFSGYSDIAIGTARLFGIDLMRNFAYPYFSRDIAEFWRRWHISLSTWFRDYVYIPLGGSRGTALTQIRNIFVIFVVSGFWHGANWTFIVWGLLHAIFFLPLAMMHKNRRNTDTVAAGRFLPAGKECLQMGATFILTCIAWVFFRAETLGQATEYLSITFSGSLFSIPQVFPTETLAFIALLIAAEWMAREKQHALELDKARFAPSLRWGLYYAMIALIAHYGGVQQQFIYFQF